MTVRSRTAEKVNRDTQKELLKEQNFAVFIKKSKYWEKLNVQERRNECNRFNYLWCQEDYVQ